MTKHKINIDNLETNVLAGNATITLESTVTGKYYTYKIKQKKDNPNVHFLSILSSPDKYTYFGTIFNRKDVKLTQKSKATKDTVYVKAFVYFFKAMIENNTMNLSKINVYHSGSCNRCGRKLTTPESITYGLGPYCKTKV